MKKIVSNLFFIAAVLVIIMVTIFAVRYYGSEKGNGGVEKGAVSEIGEGLSSHPAIFYKEVDQ